MFYNAYVRSSLEYGIIIWGASKNIERLLIIQKSIIRTIAKVGYREHCKNIFISLGLMTVYSLYLFNLVNFVFDNRDKFTTNNEINTGMKTRNAESFEVPRHNTSSFEKSPYYRALTAFNNLPKHLKIIGDKNKFKNETKTFFKANPFYSIEEFFSMIM